MANHTQSRSGGQKDAKKTSFKKSKPLTVGDLEAAQQSLSEESDDNEFLEEWCLAVESETKSGRNSTIPDEEDEDAGEDKLYCLCQSPYSSTEFMLRCDSCHDWLHGSCVGISEVQSEFIDQYCCPRCVRPSGLIQWATSDHRRPNIVKTVKQKVTRMDYHAVIYSWERSFSGSKAIKLKKKSQPSVLGKHAIAHGVEDMHCVFPAETPLDIDNIMSLAGESLAVKVSHNHSKSENMRLSRWKDIFTTDMDMYYKFGNKFDFEKYIKGGGKKFCITHVWDFDFSGTLLDELMESPKVINEIDWSQHYTDKVPHIDIGMNRYCSMLLSGAYCDFQFSPGGCSRWIHVHSGSLVMLVIKPTDDVLQTFELWKQAKQLNQPSVFFGDLVSECIKEELKEGDVMFLPSGYLFAILALDQTILFSGLYLNNECAPMQARILDLDQKLKSKEENNSSSSNNNNTQNLADLKSIRATQLFGICAYVQDLKKKYDTKGEVDLTKDELSQLRNSITSWNNELLPDWHSSSSENFAQTIQLMEELMIHAKTEKCKREQIPMRLKIKVTEKKTSSNTDSLRVKLKPPTLKLKLSAEMTRENVARKKAVVKRNQKSAMDDMVVGEEALDALLSPSNSYASPEPSEEYHVGDADRDEEAHDMIEEMKVSKSAKRKLKAEQDDTWTPGGSVKPKKPKPSPSSRVQGNAKITPGAVKPKKRPTTKKSGATTPKQRLMKMIVGGGRRFR
eukprot:m.108822 g.108822  ORF g.108822 m.108822 type:complete len:733 (+) comp13982_c0_seq2:225-2423(+)